MRSHSTKFQLKEKSLDAIFILSNTLRALLLFKIQKNSVFSVIFRSSASLTHSQCIWHVPLRLFLLSGAPHAHLASSWRRWHAGPPSPASSAASGPPVAADRRHTTAGRRSALPKAPWLSAWPHARQRTPVAQPPWPASTGRALRRRRARAIPVPSSSPLTPKPRPV